MTVNGIWLKSFRGYREAAIDLKPLTVLLGPNSSGKSSFGHAISAMAHAHWISNATNEPVTLSPGRDADTWPVDLGGFSDLRTVGSDDVAVQVGLRTRGGWVSFGFGPVGGGDEMALCNIDLPGEPSETSGRAIPSPMSTAAVDPSSVSQPGEPLRILRSGTRLTRRTEREWYDQNGNLVRIGLSGLAVTGLASHGRGTYQVNDLGQLDVVELLDKVGYLRGTRKRPTRGYERRRSERQPIGYAGEFAVDAFQRLGANPAEFCEVPQISESSGVGSIIDREWTRSTQPLQDWVGYWLTYLDLASGASAKVAERNPALTQLRVDVDGSKHTRDITEVGYGLSQVFPVIVGGLLQPAQSLFIVDLPEAHLHPRPQGALADFFCAMALSGRNVLLETHSVMLFNQLRLRAATSEKLASLIQVYFIDEATRDQGCCRPENVGLDLEGQRRWPRGFMNEAWDTEVLIRQARALRQRKHG